MVTAQMMQSRRIHHRGRHAAVSYPASRPSKKGLANSASGKGYRGEKKTDCLCDWTGTLSRFLQEGEPSLEKSPGPLKMDESLKAFSGGGMSGELQASPSHHTPPRNIYKAFQDPAIREILATVQRYEGNMGYQQDFEGIPRHPRPRFPPSFC